ncbi:uncharacterized protein [Macrobrachium rosenbergii]|uniref:uncharacterized protein n=1 Tax=Macrobrachium rosenbergii TaxID=79674 RepID=UPI0034D67250
MSTRSQQSEDFKFFMSSGKELGLSGRELRDWVQERMEATQAEKQAQERREAAGQEREVERREREAERQAQEKREEAEREERDKQPPWREGPYRLQSPSAGGLGELGGRPPDYRKGARNNPERWRRRWRGQVKEANQTWADWAYQSKCAPCQMVRVRGVMTLNEAIEQIKIEHFLLYTLWPRHARRREGPRRWWNADASPTPGILITPRAPAAQKLLHPPSFRVPLRRRMGNHRSPLCAVSLRRTEQCQSLSVQTDENTTTLLLAPVPMSVPELVTPACKSTPPPPAIPSLSPPAADSSPSHDSARLLGPMNSANCAG